MLYAPESKYEAKSYSMDELKEKYASQELITFKVLFWNDTKKCLVASLGYGIYGYIPETELCIEKLKYAGSFSCSVQAHSILGNIACALIQDITPNGEVILSRKKLQIEALKSLSIGSTYRVVIKSITPIGFFVDVGIGISAFIHNSEITKTPFKDIKDLGFKVGSSILAKLTQVKGFIKMSYRRAFSFPILSKGDCTYGIVRNRLFDKTGYFVELSPNDTGIVDTDFSLKYGEKVLVAIKSSTVNGNDDDYYVQHHVKLLSK